MAFGGGRGRRRGGSRRRPVLPSPPHPPSPCPFRGNPIGFLILAGQESMVADSDHDEDAGSCGPRPRRQQGGWHRPRGVRDGHAERTDAGERGLSAPNPLDADGDGPHSGRSRGSIQHVPPGNVWREPERPAGRLAGRGGRMRQAEPSRGEAGPMGRMGGLRMTRQPWRPPVPPPRPPPAARTPPPSRSEDSSSSIQNSCGPPHGGGELDVGARPARWAGGRVWANGRAAGARPAPRRRRARARRAGGPTAGRPTWTADTAAASTATRRRWRGRPGRDRQGLRRRPRASPPPRAPPPPPVARAPWG